MCVKKTAEIVYTLLALNHKLYFIVTRPRACLNIRIGALYKFCIVIIISCVNTLGIYILLCKHQEIIHFLKEDVDIVIKTC